MSNNGTFSSGERVSPNHSIPNTLGPRNRTSCWRKIFRPIQCYFFHWRHNDVIPEIAAPRTHWRHTDVTHGKHKSGPNFFYKLHLILRKMYSFIIFIAKNQSLPPYKQKFLYLLSLLLKKYKFHIIRKYQPQSYFI